MRSGATPGAPLPWARAAAWQDAGGGRSAEPRGAPGRRCTAELSAGLRRDIASAPVGETMQASLAVQVGLITSLPLDAAQWVHEASLEALTVGSRYPERSALERGWDPEEQQVWTRG